MKEFCSAFTNKNVFFNIKSVAYMELTKKWNHSMDDQIYAAGV